MRTSFRIGEISRVHRGVVNGSDSIISRRRRKLVGIVDWCDHQRLWRRIEPGSGRVVASIILVTFRENISTCFGNGPSGLLIIGRMRPTSRAKYIFTYTSSFCRDRSSVIGLECAMDDGEPLLFATEEQPSEGIANLMPTDDINLGCLRSELLRYLISVPSSWSLVSYLLSGRKGYALFVQVSRRLSSSNPTAPRIS